MKVLVIGAFDPCCVHLRQRKWLQPFGIEMRIAVQTRYWDEHAAIEWTLPNDFADVAAYADRADLVVYLPSIEAPWSSERDAPKFEDHGFSQHRPCLYLFHGSVNAALNAEVYAGYYSRFGMVAATTLDYVARMNCEYVPSIVDVGDRAKPRTQHESLRVVHAPSDPKVCSTSEFRHVAQGRAHITYLNSVPHAAAMRFKARCHVGFDHLRGAFSINSLENACIGLVNLVGMSDAVTEEADKRGIVPGWPRIKTMDDVKHWLEKLQDHRVCKFWQGQGRAWFEQQWQPVSVARRIADVYKRAARG